MCAGHKVYPNPYASPILSMQTTLRSVDIFCRVVDNYGDAGVCWRLARQLVAEHGLKVTLHIDALAVLARMAPGLDPDAALGFESGVEVRRLAADRAIPALPDLVVEAFGCGLPANYLAAMARARRPPRWINLEYLSAERWIESVHGLASPQPKEPLTRYFYMPGFVPNAGGLLRERGLLAARDAWLADANARTAWWRNLGVAPFTSDTLAISLFCYPNAAFPALFDAWAEGDAPVVCAVPEGVATAALDGWLAGDVPHAGQVVERGRLKIIGIPFVPQSAYDHLLWSCDLNFVRGEDSFVRAQWAAKPLVWHVYPQEEAAHLVKLQAFLDRYTAGLDNDVADSLHTFWQAFNGEDGATCAAAWPRLRAAIAPLKSHAQRWSGHIAQLPDLASRLLEFGASEQPST
jgi:uncharacterized repeat protein (TIGR03837 family)